MIRGDSKALRFWEERYQTDRIPWDRSGISPAMTQWLDSADLQPCRIVIPGCGYGYEVAELARRGFDVTAIDFAPSAVAAVKKDLEKSKLRAWVIEADILKWNPEQPFDAIYEQTCLCALPPKLWKRYSERLDRWLKPAGKLFALFMQTHEPGGPPYHCDLNEMHTLFPDDQWTWPDGPLLKVPHPVGFYELAGVIVKKS
ncbi:MAG: methyltransferase domain-containing protein [Burkholderiales bacterium]